MPYYLKDGLTQMLKKQKPLGHQWWEDVEETAKFLGSSSQRYVIQPLNQ